MKAMSLLIMLILFNFRNLASRFKPAIFFIAGIFLFSGIFTVNKAEAKIINLGASATSDHIYVEKTMGIGTTNASYPFSILGAASTAGNNLVSGSNFFVGVAGDNGLYARQRGNSAGISGITFANQFFSNAGGAFELYTAGSHPLILGTLATERIRIDEAGNVGIGTSAVTAGRLLVMGGNVGIGNTNPTAANLSVTGNISATNGFRINTTDVVTSGRIVQSADGTAAAPAFTFSANTNTGIWRPGTSLLAFSTAGAERMRIVANGSTGVGVTAPTYNLDVNTSLRAQNINVKGLTDTAAGPVWATAAGDLYRGAAGPATENYWILSGNNLAASTTAWNVGIGTTNAGNNKLTVIGGNVGIGTTNAGSLLTISNNQWISSVNVAGTGYANMFKVNTSNQIEVGSPLLIGPLELAQDGGFLTFIDMPVTSAAANGSLQGYSLKIDGNSLLNLYSTSNGAGGINNPRVGIGTTNPGFALDVSGQVNASGGLCIGGDCKTAWSQVVSAAGDYWGLNGSNLYASSTAWNVGIGTTNPGSKLELRSSTNSELILNRIGGWATGYAGIKMTTDDAGTDYWRFGMIPNSTNNLYLNRNATTFLAVDSNSGNVGIGTTNPGSARLAIIGGNVGIGTNNPSSGLHVANSSGPVTLKVESTGTAAGSRADMIFASSLGNSSLRFDAETNGVNFIQSRNYAGDGNQPLSFTGYSGNQGSIVTFNFASSNFTGNVGIGLTNPTYNLDVNTSLRANSVNVKSLNVAGLVANTGSGDLFTVSGTSGQTLRHNGTNWSAVSNLYNNGTNVGVGTTNPAEKLSVSGSTERYTFSSSDGGFRTFGVFHGTAPDGVGVGSKTSYPLFLFTGNQTSTPALFIRTNNNVGIGTTAPAATFHVNGSMIFKRTPVANVAYSVQPGDYIVGYTSLSANRILTLPVCDAAATGRVLIIANEVNSAYSVIVTPQSPSLISGFSSFSLSSYSTIPVYCNGANWFIY